jgi:hypothetical protein
MKRITIFTAIILMMFFEPKSLFSQIKPNSIIFSVSTGMNFRGSTERIGSGPAINPTSAVIAGSVGATFLQDVLFASIVMEGKNAFVIETNEGEKIEKFSIMNFSSGISLPKKKFKKMHGPIAGFNAGMASSNDHLGCFISGAFIQINDNIKLDSKCYLRLFTRVTYNFLALQEINFGSKIEVGAAIMLAKSR